MRPCHRRRCFGRNRPNYTRFRPCLETVTVPRATPCTPRLVRHPCHMPSSSHTHPWHGRHGLLCGDRSPSCSWVNDDLCSSIHSRRSKCSHRDFPLCKIQDDCNDITSCASGFQNEEQYQVIDCDTQTFQENVRIVVEDDCTGSRFTIDPDAAPPPCSFHRKPIIPCSSKALRKPCGHLTSHHICPSMSGQVEQSDKDFGRSCGMLTSTPCVQDRGTMPNSGDTLDETVQAQLPSAEGNIRIVPCGIKNVRSAPIVPCEKLCYKTGGDMNDELTLCKRVPSNCIKCPRKSVSFGSPCFSTSNEHCDKGESSNRMSTEVSSTVYVKCKCSLPGDKDLKGVLKGSQICACSIDNGKDLSSKRSSIETEGEMRMCKCTLFPGTQMESNQFFSENGNGVCSKRKSSQSQVKSACKCSHALDSTHDESKKDKKKKQSVICECHKYANGTDMGQSNGDVYNNVKSESARSSSTNITNKFYTDNSSMKSKSSSGGNSTPGNGMSRRNSNGAMVQQKNGHVNCSCPYNANSANSYPETDDHCTCHYPPAFGQMGCTGNISGNCNCGNNG